MISEWYAKRYCADNIKMIENYDEAIADKSQMWDCHHRLEIVENKTEPQLKAEGRYYNRPASELIFIPESEHHKLHMSGKNFTVEHRRKISESLKGKPTWIKGQKLSAAHKKALSESHKGQCQGMIWITNGKICKRVYPNEIPSGYVRGKKIKRKAV